jgi:probable HAF family extracellular repeat protein
VVGQGYRFQATEAIRWNGGNITGLGLLPAGLAAGSALDANADGTVVVGWAGVNPSGAEEAFRWTAESGMVGLGTLEPDWGRFSRANAVSADGRVVVGESESSAGFFGREAFLWDEAGGMRSLKEELETVYGDELLDWTLLRATGISDDGKVVVGTGYFEPTLTEVAFRAELVPAPVPELATYRWSGPLKSREIAPGQAPIYRNVQMGEDMEGFFTIGITDLGGTFVPPGTYEFPGEEFFGSITGRGITIETALSTRPLEVRFLDNHLPEPGELALFNSCLGTSLPEGTRFDLAEIEVDLSFGIKRLEFGVSLISLDLNWLSGADYREFPSLDEVDLGLYFVVEDRLGEEIYNAVGVLTEFAKEQVDPIVITDVRRSADTVTIEFRSTPSVSTWRIRGTAGLDQPFSEDLTALPGTTIMEEPLVPGTYHAVVDVAGRGGRYFLRVER